MKTQQLRETAAARINPAVVDNRPRIVNQKAIFPQPDYLEPGYESWPRPTQLELANLAARLARTEKIDPKQLVQAAWELYMESCRKIEADHVAVGKLVEELDAQDDELLLEETGGWPQPKKFPVTFREMELLLLPKHKGRTGDRAGVIREYALAQILEGSFRLSGGFRALNYWDFQPDALKELREKYSGLVATRFGSWRGKAYDAGAYARFAVPFLRWYERWLVHRKSQLKSDNARRGWVKRKAKAEAKAKALAEAKAKQQRLEGAAEVKGSGKKVLAKARREKKRKPQPKSAK